MCAADAHPMSGQKKWPREGPFVGTDSIAMSRVFWFQHTARSVTRLKRHRVHAKYNTRCTPCQKSPAGSLARLQL